MNLPDIQETKPDIPISIKQVGVENVEVPFRLESKYKIDGIEFYDLVANVSMTTNLDSRAKGISMSRLLRTLRKYLYQPLKQTLVKTILMDIAKNVGSKNAFMKFEFRLPMERKSPVSKYSFPIYYPCRFEGRLIQDRIDLTRYHYTFYQGVKIQYASYCPCSAELCNHLDSCSERGYPHNQRSYADVLVESIVDKGQYVWLEDVIEAIESVIPTLPYPIIKRVDEREIAKIAAENPLFVEDAIRLITKAIDDLPIYDWIVKCIHEESIHTSEAIAVNWKGVPEGLDGRRFI
jgi:GTP cyclohydrolase I